MPSAQILLIRSPALFSFLIHSADDGEKNQWSLYCLEQGGNET